MVDIGLRTLTTMVMNRVQALRGSGISYGGKRNLNDILGYDESITVRQYLEEYARGGIAKRLVEVMPKATWRGGIGVAEDENPKESSKFEKTWTILDERLHVRQTLERVDMLSGLSTFAVLLIGAKGELSDPLPRAKNESSLLYLTPFLGSGNGLGQVQRTVGDNLQADASIFSFDTDPSSSRFGLPEYYQCRRMDAAQPLLQTRVHWSRVLHVAEGCLQDEVYGIPVLESIWNLLMDLHKVTGGGAEAYWLRANQGMHIDIDKDMVLKDAAAEKESLGQQAEDYKHQLTRWIKTRGVSINPLGSDVAGIIDPADAIITQIAGSKGIPKRILTGSEMGELASSQDRENFKDLVVGRQESYAGPYVFKRLVDRLIEFGYLPTPTQPTYTAKWHRMQALMERERTAGARGWASVNSSYGSVVFTASEIRDKWAELPPLTPEQLKEIEEEAARKTQQEATRAGEMAKFKDPSKQAPLGQAEDKETVDEDNTEDAEDLKDLEAAFEIGDNAAIITLLGVGQPIAGELPTLGILEPAEAAHLRALTAAIETGDAVKVLSLLGVSA